MDFCPELYLLVDEPACPDMRKDTLEVLAGTVGIKSNGVTVPEEIGIRATQVAGKMLAVTLRKEILFLDER